MGRPKKTAEVDQAAEVETLQTQTVAETVTPAPAKKRNRTCIAPKCRKQSLGPRNRFLCTEHKATDLEVVRSWQAAAKN